MRELNHHICELLYDHDCVIVPRLGGFLASYSGATIHPVLHTINPPARKVAFNVYLKQNDGLLANHLSGIEKTSYLEAVNKIEAYAAACHRELRQGKRVVLEGIGIFYNDSEQNLQFEPAPSANFLKDSFGLSPIRHLPLNREESRQKIEKPLKEFVSIRPSVKKERKGTGQARKVLSRIVLAGAVLWLGASVFLVLKDNKETVANMQPHKNRTEVTPPKHIARPEVAETSVQPTVNVESTAAIISVPETSYMEKPAEKPAVEPSMTESEPMAMHVQRNFSEKEISSPAPSINTEVSVSEKKLSSVNKASTVSTESKGEARYYIIAGAFKVPENASSLVARLQAEGFSNAQIVPTSGKLVMVCYDASATRKEASHILDSIHTQDRDGWVMVK